MREQLTEHVSLTEKGFWHITDYKFSMNEALRELADALKAERQRSAALSEENERLKTEMEELKKEALWAVGSGVEAVRKSYAESNRMMREDLDQTREENERMRKQAARYRAALEKIRDAEGRVCQEFETCEHAACDSSYGAWEIANVALRGAPHEDGEEAIK